MESEGERESKMKREGGGERETRRNERSQITGII